MKAFLISIGIIFWLYIAGFFLELLNTKDDLLNMLAVVCLIGMIFMKIWFYKLIIKKTKNEKG